MLLLFFLSVLEDNYSLQVTLLDYQYQKDYENLNSAPAQELRGPAPKKRPMISG